MSITLTLDIGLAAVAAAFYLGSAATFYVEVARASSTPGPKPSAWPPLLLAVGAAAHLGSVLVAGLVAHSCPVNSVPFFASIATVLAAGLYLVTRRRLRIHALGLILAPVGLTLALAVLLWGTPRRSQALPPSFIALHVFAILCGAALFLLACAAAVLYLVQERRLKRKTAMLSGGMPALDTLDRTLHRALLAGFPLLTLGVVTGTIHALQLHEGSAVAWMRTLFGYATWLVFGAVLLLRLLAGWRGRRSAYGTLAGFACALVVLLLYLLRPWLHGSGPGLGGVGG
jgi:ABC-type uncharacterized transport system permease subunit